MGGRPGSHAEQEELQEPVCTPLACPPPPPMSRPCPPQLADPPSLGLAPVRPSVRPHTAGPGRVFETIRPPGLVVAPLGRPLTPGHALWSTPREQLTPALGCLEPPSAVPCRAGTRLAPLGPARLHPPAPRSFGCPCAGSSLCRGPACIWGPSVASFGPWGFALLGCACVPGPPARSS